MSLPDSETLPPETEDALVALLAVRDGLIPEAAVQKLLLKSDGSKRLARQMLEAGRLSLEDKKSLLARLDPELISGYRIEAEAGRGGMGVVYRARQISMDRIAALKVLSRSCSEDAEFVERFIAEARSAARLNHEHVVAAIDAGSAGGLHYFVMEYVDGRSVADLLEEGPLSQEQAFTIVEQIAHALDHAHGKGIVHRDVKPENIMLSSDGVAKLCDLGLARPAAVAGTGEKSDTTEGTPYYCSPEQALGRTDIDARSDIYSLGMTLFHMLKGEPAFDGETARQILLKQVREDFPNLALALPELPKWRRKLLESMVVKDRQKRMASARVFLERLAAGEVSESQQGSVDAGEPGQGQLPRLVVGAALLLLLLLVAFALRGGGDDEPEGSPTAVASSSTRNTPRPTRSGSPRRVDTPQPTQPGVDEHEASADTALAAARRWRDQNPDDVSGYRDRLELVAGTFGDTYAGQQARDRLVELVREEKQMAQRAFKRVADHTATLVQSGQFREAHEAVDSFATQWADRLGASASRLDDLKALVLRQAAARWEAVQRELGGLSAEEGRALLSEFARQAPPSLEPQVAALTAELEGRAAALGAQAAWATLAEARDLALRQGDLPEATRLLAQGKLADALAPVAAEIDQAQAELGLIAQAWRACDVACQALVGGQPTLRPAGRPEVRARVTRYDPRAWSFTLESGETLDLRALEGAQPLEWVLPPAEGRANVLFFLARRAAAAARAALEAWRGAGGAPAAELVAAVGTLEVEAREASEEARLRRLLDEDLAPDEVVNGIRALDRAARATASYGRLFSSLQAAYLRARVAQLAGDPRNLLKGEVTSKRGGLTQIRYDFDEPEQAEDWITDPDLIPDKSSVRWEDGALHVTGKVRHRAVLSGGELKVELKASSADEGRPNLNVVIGDQGGWSGSLFGLGFIYGALSRVTIDPGAPRKPGYKVSLPANVFLVLQGHPPRGRDPWQAAENEPSLLGNAGKSWRVRIERDDEGEVRLRAGASRVYDLPPAPGWDTVGRVALLPFSAELELVGVTITGTLDPAWLQQGAQEAAEQEALALPPPGS